MIDAKEWPDENLPLGLDLPDEEFVATRQMIIDLLPKLVKRGSLRHKSQDVLAHIVDETVMEIGKVWKNRYEHN